MTPQELKESLWTSYAHIENISIECGRTTMEMTQGETVEEYLSLALRAIALSIDIVNGEYFPEVFENIKVEDCKYE